MQNRQNTVKNVLIYVPVNVGDGFILTSYVSKKLGLYV